ncbi:MAG: hypothetical protein LBL15_01680 [Oscillospiraceae bacterium]|jgi:FSR family fosmidomycin resistance protein-like MFS transporter|nr:hypothetical protein [Oscillospiraceae bacterium]
MISVYSVTHFLVDFACAFLMFRSISGTPDWYLCVLLYNFCAFAMQMPLGILADKWSRNYLFAAIGCGLVGAAYGLWQFPAEAAIAAGIGNGMFHIGGGIDVLNVSEEKSGALGVFVSPGAFGIYFGTILGKGRGLTGIPILLALLAAIGAIFAVRRAQGGACVKNAAFSLNGWTSPRMLTAAACLFFVVCLRAYVSLTLSFPWKSAGCWGVVLVCAVVFGKTAGGLASDRFGLAKTACMSSGLAALLFLIPHIPAAGVLSMLLFNMTMPVTLWVMAKILPGAKGFSFGLLTFGLFLGFLPAYSGVSASSDAPWLFTLAAAVSFALLFVSLRKAGP